MTCRVLGLAIAPVQYALHFTVVSKHCLTTDDQTAAHVCTLCYDITIKSTYVHYNKLPDKTRPLTLSPGNRPSGSAGCAWLIAAVFREKKVEKASPAASQKAIPAVAVSGDD